jgi:hypothetical protein
MGRVNWLSHAVLLGALAVNASAALQTPVDQADFAIRIPVVEGVSITAMTSELLDLGYSPVERAELQDREALQVGLFAERADADRALEDLTNEGYVGAEIISLRGGFPVILAAAVAAGLLALGGAGFLLTRRKRPAAVHAPAHAQTAARPRTAEVPPGGRVLTPAVLTPPPLVPTPEEARRRKQNLIPRAPIPLFADDFDQSLAGEPPHGWSLPESGVASLEMADGESGPVLDYQKAAIGSGGLCWCALPKCRGQVTVEIDMVCHEKNSYLLGLYLQEGQDFRRAIQTQFQAGVTGAGRVRIQSVDAPLPFGVWGRITYDIDLESQTLSAALNGQRLGEPIPLINAPDHIDTLVIRSAPETIGRLSIGRIRIWSGQEAPHPVA